MAELTRILVVDDDADARCFVQAMLAAAGEYEFFEAEDGNEGLAKTRECEPDLIILDIQMPNKDGFATFKDLRSDDATAAIPVIMLTGVGDQTGISFSAEEMDGFLGCKPDAYLEKPIDPTILQQTVAKVLAG